ncbi:hypothetical protein CVD28_02345 [Bacillus sp. M6-12]|uniref:hypothetical protein n=1 Tax=Bacillus sp. M6-12 TaxID=2054166 RepID=UPI000C794EC0|nr:hypothetical protein [Bacillus sp. M6-12]PLS19273.1 hypothetical protein CVD28_02345 [Bacillus sp. M6-12]
MKNRYVMNEPRDNLKERIQVLMEIEASGKSRDLCRITLDFSGDEVKIKIDTTGEYEKVLDYTLQRYADYVMELINITLSKNSSIWSNGYIKVNGSPKEAMVAFLDVWVGRDGVVNCRSNLFFEHVLKEEQALRKKFDSLFLLMAEKIKKEEEYKDYFF